MTVEYGKLTFLEIKEKAAEGYLAIIPTGCTEQQGPHSTVDFDTWLATELSIEAAQQAKLRYGVKSLVIPTIPFGPTPEHRSFGYGFIDIPQKLYEDVIYAVLTSLVDQGFRQLVIFRGCGGHLLGNVAVRFNQEYEGKAKVDIPHHPFHEIWCRHADPDIPGGHADSFTTSLGLYKHPEDIREAQIFNPGSSEPEWDDPNLDFGKYSTTGVIGDPTHASRDLGEKLWNGSVEAIAAMLQEIALAQ
ncbi:creatininase [Paenibacillus sp. FSL H7-0357]|uniref:creatininase family protein n=1 Tax=unclassified Paenibacillus TaxID=185978 RepID=UPI0004F7C0EE|nr:creatininase family protein [Paenibacillus sp. FSL H7-0357]AIQ17767.1 creatininase [Paenibacillus sp. FSL H7-0357]